MNEARPGALELIAMVLDEGSWRSWDTQPRDPAGLPASYAAELAAARAGTGLTESVVTGEGSIDGRRVAVAACEFGFLAGSIGTAAAGRLVRCVERATADRLPLVASPASGGTRMQEGTPAFAQMASISAAVARHRAAGLPYLVYLRHPTTGGVLASWGSLGHVTAAEPGALIGFLGPRVYRALHGEPFPAGVQRAENLAAHGLLDGVVRPAELREVAARALRVLAAGAETAEPEPGGAEPEKPEPGAETEEPEPGAETEEPEPGAEPEPAAGPGVPAWESVRRSRRPERPGLRDLLAEAAADVSLLLGTGEGERDPALLLALARFGTEPCVVTGHDRRPGAELPPGPAGLRAAQRGMRLAAELGLPLVTVIDTAGAALSPEAEQGGLAGEIARALA
ncbi:MAG: acetyl-CoA carboxyl transferase, partial [Actinobacteria bacterium]|nr:acetyl-CoA carboxyl transferase [Actinomycetota bacterium]